MKLKNKVAIITGGSKGIGKSVAIEFAKQGAKIVICDIDIKKGKEVNNQIKKLGFESIFIKCDVRKKEEIIKTVNKTIKTFKKIDILVNNAGIHLKKEISQTEESEWNNLINTNLKGIFLFVSQVSKHMIQNKKGKIISISSILGNIGFSNTAVYSAANGGIINITRALALELSPHKINVNAVSPGIIATEMYEETLSNKKLKKELLSNIPLDRIGLPEDVAEAVVFLASEDSNFITGHNLVVDGGWLSH